ncbi:MAG: MFS transporter [Candidatus Korobacteraceae bacterium]|jgi:MFS family permease
MFDWFTGLTKREKTTFWACLGGWSVDAMDTQMYPLAIPTLIALWGMTRGQAGMLATAVLIVAAIGGWLAGVLADRIGRVRVLQLTILWFAVFTFLSGLTSSFWQLLLTRSLQGLGFGGEWAAGAVLLSETINPQVRGRVVGVIQSGWALGYGTSVLLATGFFSWFPPTYSWRLLFMTGLLPALAVLWIRRSVQESQVYTDSQRDRQATSARQKTKLWDIFKPEQATMTLKAVLLTIGIYGGNYVMITWLPAYLRIVWHLSVLSTGGYLAINILGSFAGGFVNGYLADAIGRRKTFIVCAFIQAVTVAVYTLAPITANLTLALGFVLGCMQGGMAGGTGAYLSELFPTRIRGTASGFCGNAGRAFGALMPTMVGILSARMALGTSMGICALSAYVLVVIAALILPETRGRDLRSLDQADASALKVAAAKSE